MRNSDVVLNNLEVQARDGKYRFEKLIRNLYNPEMYFKALGKLYANRGAGTPGSDGTSINGFSDKDIEEIIEEIKNETYEPTPLRRVYIPKKDGKKRPLGMPNFKDKIVQEVIRMTLEAIYEPTFSDSSHGFRPNRSCHTALRDIDINYTGIKWFVEGDIKGCFDNINHHILLKILQKRINDQKLLRLINKFLKSGYIEDWKYHKTYSGTPQGGIISPLLANIYMNELDSYIEVIKNGFDKGSAKKRRTNPNYGRISSKLHRRRMKFKETNDNELLKEIKTLEKELLSIPYYEEDDSYRKLSYVRYADDFLIGIIGTKEDAERIKRKIKSFLKTELDLELSEEKTLVTHVSKRAKFLGYEITKRVPKLERTAQSHGITRKANGNLEFYMNPLHAQKWLKDAGIITYKKDGSWKPCGRRSLSNLSDLELIQIHNSELRGIYNYFKFAKNIHNQMSTLIYASEYSFYGTICRKRKLTVGQVAEKLRIGKEIGVRYNTKKGPKVAYFFKGPINRLRPAHLVMNQMESDVDYFPNMMKFRGRTELERRLMAKECEMCGEKSPDGIYHLHHTNKLKDLKKLPKKTKWMEEKIARNRKVLVVCKDCHWKIHDGTL
ncbi:MAG: reverse transcriptase/maturase family protein [Caryophanon sp.]|nr:reverse transcriptase/maturase family protein [Caryophanon sp.]